jgi:hypothetical protein
MWRRLSRFSVNATVTNYCERVPRSRCGGNGKVIFPSHSLKHVALDMPKAGLRSHKPNLTPRSASTVTLGQTV